MRLPNQDSKTGRALKTALQGVLGFLAGLVLTVWAVPGVPGAVLDYVQKNFLALALFLGVNAGLASFVWNLFRSKVKLY